MNKYTKKFITKRKIQSKNKKLNKSRIGKFNLYGGALDISKLDNVLQNFDGFVWDFDDTIANKIVDTGNTKHLSMNDALVSEIIAGNLEHHTIKDFFYEPDNFVELVNYLVSKGKTVGIISFGYPDRILQLLRLLFGEECPFNNTNIYGVDRAVLAEPARTIREKFKVNFMSLFIDTNKLKPERILFFDDDFKNTNTVSRKLQCKGISLIGAKSRQVHFKPTTFFKDGFSIKILYLINKLLSNKIPFDSNLLFTSEPDILEISSTIVSEKAQLSRISRGSHLRTALRRKPVKPSGKPSGKPSHIPSSVWERTNNSSENKSLSSTKNRIPARGWSNRSSNNSNSPPLPPRPSRSPGSINFHTQVSRSS